MGPASVTLAASALPGIDRWEDVLSGAAKGPVASLKRWALWAASLAYGIGCRWHRFSYQFGLKRPFQLPVPVVSIGNLTAGGTGKTPMVAWVARLLREEGLMVTILSRGYGSVDGAANDEALVLADLCPDVPHLQGPDRAVMGLTAISELGASILVLDDGFQHHRLKKDLEIVLVDATCPWGHGHLLPRGLLREPRAVLALADAVVLTRCDLADGRSLDELRRKVGRLAPGKPVLLSNHRPASITRESGETRPADWLKGREVAAFCGLGRPAAFRATLEAAGARVIAWREFPDHHPYSRDDIRSLREWAADLPGETAVLCTHKDLVKVRLDELAGKPLWRLDIALEISDPEQALPRLLAPLARRADEIERRRDEEEGGETEP